MRILIAGLDIFGIILIGLLLTKTTSELSNSTSNSTFLSVSKFVSNFSIFQLALVALILFLTKSALAIFFMKIMTNSLAKSEQTIARNLFKNLFRIEYAQISKFSRSELSYALTFSSAYGITSLLMAWVVIISESALLIAIVALFIFINFKIALGMSVYFALVGLGLYKILSSRMEKTGSLYAESATNSGDIVDGAMGAYREILSLQKQNEFIEKFGDSRSGLAKASANQSFYLGMPRYIVESALMVGAILLAGYLFTQTNPTYAAGMLGIFLTGGLRITASLIPLQSSVAAFKQFSAQSETFFNLIALTKNARNSSNRPQSNQISTEPVALQFRNVTFYYPDAEKPALKNVDFEINRGEYVALIGPSGSGKSTIADLLSNLISPSSGSIQVNNQEHDLIQIGYVPQTPGIFSGSILQNITLNVNSNEFNKENLDFALENSHLSELVASLENGIYSDLGAQKDNLSGGQLQRIGLARALYAKPGLLILDEATSALDAETESAINDSLRMLKGKCSILVIAHRLATVQNADRVYLLNDGEIIDSGRFQELAGKNELVARYVQLSQINVN